MSKAVFASAFAALALMASGCGDAWPTSADLPAITAEVAAEDGVLTEGGSPELRAVRDSMRYVYDADKKSAIQLAKVLQRQEIYSYLFRDESYIGGTFPLGTAELLRKADELEGEYIEKLAGFRDVLTSNVAKTDASAEERAAVVAELAGAFEAQRKPVIAALEAHRKFATATAELYELMGERPKAIQAKRDGLYILDDELQERFEAQIEICSKERDAVQSALDALDAEQRKILHWLRLAESVRRSVTH